MLSPVHGSVSRGRTRHDPAKGRKATRTPVTRVGGDLPRVVPDLCRTTGPFGNLVKVWCEI